jgi:hypothetical protein
VLSVLLVETVSVVLVVLAVDDTLVVVVLAVNVGHATHTTGQVARANVPNMLSCAQR